MTKFSQHFLIDNTVLRTMTELVAKYGSPDTILEIGPGRGVLTAELVKLAKQVIAIEIDRTLGKYLDPLAQQHPNLTIIYGDVLKENLAKLGLSDYRYSIASNLPYDITGAVFKQFLNQHPYPSHLALLIQKEVAERITAKPGQLSILGLSVQVFAKPRIICTVDRTAFSPKPAVTSAIVSIEQVRQQVWLESGTEKAFFRLVKLGFAQKRKFLLNNLFNIPKADCLAAFAEIGIKQTARAQELSLKQWIALVDKLSKFIV